jgi:hypothetical protein
MCSMHRELNTYGILLEHSCEQDTVTWMEYRKSGRKIVWEDVNLG